MTEGVAEFSTTAKESFVPHHIASRAARPVQKWQPSNVKFAYKTTAQASFESYHQPPPARHKPRQNLYVDHSVPMEMRTTNGEDFVSHTDDPGLEEERAALREARKEARASHIVMGDGKFRPEIHAKTVALKDLGDDVDFARARPASRQKPIEYAKPSMPFIGITTSGTSFLEHDARPPAAAVVRKGEVHGNPDLKAEFVSSSAEAFAYDAEAVKRANKRTTMRPHTADRGGPQMKTEYVSTSKAAFVPTQVRARAAQERPKYVKSPVKFMAKSVNRADFKEWSDSKPPERYKPRTNHALPTTEAPFDGTTTMGESFTGAAGAERPVRAKLAEDNIKRSTKPMICSTTSGSAYERAWEVKGPTVPFKPDTTTKVNPAYLETRDFESVNKTAMTGEKSRLDRRGAPAPRPRRKHRRKKVQGGLM